MNNAQLYLAWLRTASPEVYLLAMRKILRQPRTLGGLDSDLVQSMTAPATFGAFGQDSSSDSSLPEITVSGSYDTTTTDPYTDLNLNPFPDVTALTPEQLAPVAPVTTSDTGPSVTITPAGGTDTGSSSWLSSFINAVGNVGASALTASNQSNLVKLNTQRAAQGLPPVNAMGQVIPGSALAPATNAIYALESKIAGGVGAMSPFLLLAGVGLLAFVLFKRKA